ncbi:MAG: HAMP domain-containing histidine kinase [Syntrophorhabdaceae bacterium]|nr:HAMP domain-containing histidine kinase [Syntrophorhabdaceae bacterium]
MSSEPKQPDRPSAPTRGLEDLGYVAGEIAHDFNSLLTGILGYASYLKTLLPEDDKKFQAASAIETSARRAAEFTRRMSECSHKEMPKPRPVIINQIVEEAVNELSAVAAEKVRISTKLGAPPSLVLGDPNALFRAFFHLGENAIEAMPNGGILTISTRPFVSGGGSVVFDNLAIPEGNYISIIFSDTGVGIPGSLLNQVFDCFFTTKPGGDGLGLPIVNRCVRKHEGFLRIDSREDGTTFEILLPILPSSI